MFGRLTVIAAALCSIAPSVLALQTKEATAPKAAALKAGDPAPALSIDKWVKGSPVASFEKGKVYVVEFWATWCGPCVASMPHMTELQREYKDKVTFISVTTKDDNNSLDQVEKMVAQKGDLMGYTVAFDKNQETKAAYRDAARTRGIPTSFVVDKSGSIVFIGHPMFLDLALKGVTAGTWDIAAGAKQVEEADQKFNALFKTIQTDPKAAIAQATELQKIAPGGMVFVGAPLFSSLVKAGSLDDAFAWAKSSNMIETAIANKNASTLNQVAWAIVDPENKIEKRDLELALKLATKADEFSEGKNAAMLDTLARTYFWKGEVKKAIEIETKAVGLAGEDKALKADLEKALAEFKSKDTQ